jgi:hypothetical protein
VGGLVFRAVLDRVKILTAYKRFFTANKTHFKERVHSRIENVGDVNIRQIFEKAESNKVFIKMDIEGAEYRIINDIVAYSSKIVGLVVEFHDTDSLRPVFITAVKTLQSKYDIVHIHANNYAYVSNDGVPDALEITFLRKDICSNSAERTEFPLPGLDMPNNPEKGDYGMKFNV